MARQEHYWVTRRQFILGSSAVAGALLVRAESASAATSRASTVTRDLRGAAASRGTRVAKLPFWEDFSEDLPGFLVKRWEKRGGVTLLGTTPNGNGRSLRGLDQADSLRNEGLAIGFDDLVNGNVIPGRIVSAEAFKFSAGSQYKLSFVVAGAHRAKRNGSIPSTILAQVPGVSPTVRTSLRNTDPFLPVELTFSPKATRRGRIEFAVEGVAGKSGVLLKNVHLQQL